MSHLLIGLCTVSVLSLARSQQVTQPNTFFSATSVPNQASGISVTGGVTYVNTDGTYRVINSSSGVPLTLRPSQTAMSSILIDAVNAQVNISNTTTTVSSYVTPYSSFLTSGGFFNLTGSINGSQLNATLPSGNTSFDLQPSEKYVLVLGNVSAPTNATYTLSTTGTKTLPGGQVVTATLIPGGLATLGHFSLTGSAQIDLQVEQQSANANGIVDFFLVDIQQAIQLQSSDYVTRTTQAAVGSQPTSSSAGSFFVGPATAGTPGGPPTPPGGSQPPPATTQADGTTVESLSYAAPSPEAGQSLSNITATSSMNTAFFAGQTATLQSNSGLKLAPSTRVSVLVNLLDYVGELYILAYYEPSPPSTGINYALPTASDPQLLVTAAFRLSSTTVASPASPQAPQTPPSPQATVPAGPSPPGLPDYVASPQQSPPPALQTLTTPVPSPPASSPPGTLLTPPPTPMPVISSPPSSPPPAMSSPVDPPPPPPPPPMPMNITPPPPPPMPDCEAPSP